MLPGCSGCDGITRATRPRQHHCSSANHVALSLCVQNRKWLTKVFKSLTVDESDRMRKLGDVLSLLPGNRPSCLGTAAIAAAGAATPPGASRAVALPDMDDDEDDDEEERARRTLAEDGSVHLTLRKLAALEELQDLTEGIDNAKNLFIVGAFPALMQCVLGEEPAPFDLPGVLPPSTSSGSSSSDAAAGAGAGAAEPGAAGASAGAGAAAAGNAAVAARALAEFGPEQFAAPPVQARAAEVLATVLQNNPAAQGWALESGCMHALVTALARATLLADSLLLQQQQQQQQQQQRAEGPSTGAATVSGAEGSAPAAASGAGASLSLARRLEDQLALQTDLLTALSALSRDNGVAQAALVSGVQTQLPLPAARAGAAASSDAPAAAAAAVAGSSAPAEGGVAGTAGEGSFTVQADAATLRQLAAACRADGQAAAAATDAPAGAAAAGATAPVRVSPFQLIAHPLLFWALYCGHPATPSSTAAEAGGAAALPLLLLPASVRSRGRRLVRKCLFFLRHLMHGVHPDAIKAACLAVNPWLLAPGAGSRLHALCAAGGTADAHVTSAASAAAAAGAETGAGAGAACVFGLEGGGLAPLLLRVLHTLPVGEPAAAPAAGEVAGAAAASTAAGAAASAEGPEADDGDARDARENCLHVLLALTQKSEAGVSVVDDTEKRRVGPGGRPVPAPTRTMQLREEEGGGGGGGGSSAVAGALPAHHAPAAGAVAAPGGDSRAAARAAGTVASVPTAAATMIEARRAREAASAVAAAGGSQPSQARQPTGAVTAGSAAPAVAGLLAAPPANYEPAPAPPAAAAGARATVTLALADGQPEAAAAAAAAPSHRPPQERQLHGLNTPSLTLPQRMAALLRGDLAVPESLLAFSAEAKRRAAAASGRAAAASAAVAASTAGSGSSDASSSADAGATSASVADATAAAAAEDAEAWQQDAELYGAEAALAESVLRRLHTAASVMRALAGQGGSA